MPLVFWTVFAERARFPTFSKNAIFHKVLPQVPVDVRIREPDGNPADRNQPPPGGLMAAKSGDGNFFAKVWNYANNATTIAGIILTTVIALLIIIFMIVEVTGGLHNPYAGMFAYVALPAFFVLTLFLIPIGIWIRRSRLLKEGKTEEELARYPRLDFNDPRLRRFGTIVLGLTGINGIILGSTSFMAVEKMESVEFCGTTCHTVMQPEYTAYQESPHSRVDCVKCHIGPGASWFVRSKIDGLRQVWHTALGDYSRPIGTPLHDLRPARETCEQCHWPNKHHGDKLRVFARFSTDEANTPSYTAMLLKTGGGSLDLGQHGGIHWWHIYSDNKIRFITGDERREEIVWCELTTADGEVRVYTREGDEVPDEAAIEAEARVMDCIDCHNRPTHLFQVPGKALDAELEAYENLRELPYFKKQALAAITESSYETREQGIEAVRTAVTSYYQSEYPELVSSRGDLIQLGADRAAEVYGRAAFPEMATDWTSHPNHIGHDDFDGCMRCHDGEMMTADEEHYIPVDCENCHVFLVEDSETRPDMASLLAG